MLVKAGRVPGTVIDLAIGDKPLSVFEVLELTGKEIQRVQERSQPPFVPNREEYKSTDGSRKMVDIPFLNGKALATKNGDHWEDIQWDTVVNDGDIVLLIPKIQGNQILVTVGQIPGTYGEYAILGAEDGEGEGTVGAALKAAGLSPKEGRLYVDGVRVAVDHFVMDNDEVILCSGLYTKDELGWLSSDELVELVLKLQEEKA
ncbi:MAG: hypothetical protein WCV80_03780 [Candidatus Paceibacterota bacterium]|jgi:hypothetical protein